MKVELIKVNGKAITLCVGAIVFPIENNQVNHNAPAKLGFEWKGEKYRYDLAYEMALLAWECQEFDVITENKK